MTDIEYSNEEFLTQYAFIKAYLTRGKSPSNCNNTILINGQPGAGKSNYEKRYIEDTDSIIIDTDEFRRFHPRIDTIKKLDAENYAERTQKFAEAITEKLITELSLENYNLVIEGTLRTYETPIKTCNQLKRNGHKVDLVVIACDACVSWESTIERAKEMITHHKKPRLVPIDKYNYNVMNLVENLKRVKEENCFDSIIIATREGQIVDLKGREPEEVLNSILNLDKWNKNMAFYEKEYLQSKLLILQQEIKKHDLR